MNVRRISVVIIEDDLLLTAVQCSLEDLGVPCFELVRALSPYGVKHVLECCDLYNGKAQHTREHRTSYGLEASDFHQPRQCWTCNHDHKDRQSSQAKRVKLGRGQSRRDNGHNEAKDKIP